MSDVLTPIRHWEETVVPSILEQYKGSRKWQAVLKASVDRLQVVENDGTELGTTFDISEPLIGARLDYVAGLVNVKRETGESDDNLWTRFITACGSFAAGTPDAAIVTASDLSGDPAPQYIDECPASFMVYTPSGTQLLRSQVRRLAPAGVLGMPGAALSLADGSFLGTADGSVLLAVARDENREV